MNNVIPIRPQAQENDHVFAAADTLIEKAMELTEYYEDAAVALVMAASDAALESDSSDNIAQMAKWLRTVADRLEQEIE
jgi:hypothetical protein